MDLRLKRLSFKPRGFVLPRSENLSAGYRKLLESSQTRLKIQVVALLALSLGSGAVAYRRSLESARLDWLKTHPPSLKTWVAVIRSAGFAELANSEAKDRASEHSPFIAREEDELYLEPDAGLLLLSRPEGRFYFARTAIGRAPKLDPKRKWNWEPLGKGWESADAITLRTFIDPKIAERSLARVPTDPKRLSY